MRATMCATSRPEVTRPYVHTTLVAATVPSSTQHIAHNAPGPVTNASVSPPDSVVHGTGHSRTSTITIRPTTVPSMTDCPASSRPGSSGSAGNRPAGASGGFAAGTLNGSGIWPAPERVRLRHVAR